MQEKNIGSVVQIIGPVLDIRFPAGHLPDLLNAIEIERDGGKLVCEVAQQLGDDVVRCIAMSSTDGMVRGMEAVRHRLAHQGPRRQRDARPRLQSARPRHR